MDKFQNALEKGFSSDFVARIRELTTCDKKSLNQRSMKLAEEVGELNAAVLRFYAAHGTRYKPNVTAENIAEEAIDIIIVATSVLAQLEIDDWNIQRLIAKKLAKWEWCLKQEETK